MKHKVGDKVKIKSLDWFNENMNEDNVVPTAGNIFTARMSAFCGRETEIFAVRKDDYELVIDNCRWSWTDDMLEDAKPTIDDAEIKTIYNLKLHEMLNADFGIAIMRVASGWIYDCWDYQNDNFKQGVFVPFDNYFQK